MNVLANLVCARQRLLEAEADLRDVEQRLSVLLNTGGASEADADDCAAMAGKLRWKLDRARVGWEDALRRFDAAALAGASFDRAGPNVVVALAAARQRLVVLQNEASASPGWSQEVERARLSWEAALDRFDQNYEVLR